MADFTRILTNLRAKLDRQQKAVDDTKQAIALFEQASKTTK